MRLFLLLVILLTSHYMGWGQHVIIKEDFEFYWPVQQYDIQGDWSLLYPAGSNQFPGNSRVLTFEGNVSWNFSSEAIYDSIYVEVTVYSYYSSGCYEPVSLQISEDGSNWVTLPVNTSWGAYHTDAIYSVNNQTYPYIKLNSNCGPRQIDNLLVIGYGNETSYDCNFDANQDGVIGAPDLMQFLAAYGTAPVCN